MEKSGAGPGRAPGAGPWFRRSSILTLVVAAVLFVGILLLPLTFHRAEDASVLLFTLPIALLALAFGRTAGLLASLLAVGLVVVWVAFLHYHLSVVGWVSRTGPLILLGGLLGDASDRLVAAQRRERALEIAAQRQRDATEVNDTLVQGMASAKWSLEAGRHEAGLATLTQTLELGHQLVSRLLRDANMGPNGHRPPPRE